MAQDTREPGPLDPNPEIWEELHHGKALMEVLEDFYTRVYADERMAPFFQGVTKQRVIEKQYSFLFAKLTGESVFFGDRPRNAHHWMVISDELFDHREDLLASCLRDHGLSDRVVQHIRNIDEVFRKQIVKSTARARRLDGIVLPFDGYGSLQMAVASLCDGSSDAIEVGEVAVYHLRTGVTYCEKCASRKELVPIETDA